jgi:hypothetical protein
MANRLDEQAYVKNIGSILFFKNGLEKNLQKKL